MEIFGLKIGKKEEVKQSPYPPRLTTTLTELFQKEKKAKIDKLINIKELPSAKADTRCFHFTAISISGDTYDITALYDISHQRVTEIQKAEKTLDAKEILSKTGPPQKINAFPDISEQVNKQDEEPMAKIEVQEDAEKEIKEENDSQLKSNISISKPKPKIFKYRVLVGNDVLKVNREYYNMAMMFWPEVNEENMKIKKYTEIENYQHIDLDTKEEIYIFVRNEPSNFEEQFSSFLQMKEIEIFLTIDIWQDAVY